MALNSVLLPAAPREVFDRLLDPRSYPLWLLGADAIRAVDDEWPAPGARFHHRVGVWPIHIDDHTEIVEIEPPRLLRLSVRATPIVRALVTFRCHGDEHGTVLTMEEEPLARVWGNIVRPVMDPATHLRNHGSLRKLGRLLSEEADGRT